MRYEIGEYEAKQLDALAPQFKENFYVKNNLLYARPNKFKEAYHTLGNVYNSMSYTIVFNKGSSKVILPGTYIDEKSGRIHFKRGEDSDVYQYMVSLTKGANNQKESTLSKIFSAIKTFCLGTKRSTSVITLGVIGALISPTVQANETQKTPAEKQHQTERPVRRLQNEKKPKMFQKYNSAKRARDKRLANTGR